MATGVALQRLQLGVEVMGNCQTEKKLQAGSLPRLLLLLDIKELFHMPQGGVWERLNV